MEPIDQEQSTGSIKLKDSIDQLLVKIEETTDQPSTQQGGHDPENPNIAKSKSNKKFESLIVTLMILVIVAICFVIYRQHKMDNDMEEVKKKVSDLFNRELVVRAN